MKLEAEVLQAAWYEGKQVIPEEGKPAPIVQLERSDAVYLQSIGRVRVVEAAAAEEKPVKANKAK